MLQTGAVARATGNAIDELGLWIGVGVGESRCAR